MQFLALTLAAVLAYTRRNAARWLFAALTSTAATVLINKITAVIRGLATGEAQEIAAAVNEAYARPIYNLGQSLPPQFLQYCREVNVGVVYATLVALIVRTQLGVSELMSWIREATASAHGTERDETDLVRNIRRAEASAHKRLSSQPDVGHKLDMDGNGEYTPEEIETMSRSLRVLQNVAGSPEAAYELVHALESVTSEDLLILLRGRRGPFGL
jgi:hypothetical protein